MNLFFKILAAVFTGLFIYAIAVQYNDPDATRWYLYYGVAALASVLFIFNQLRISWAAVLLGFYVFMMFQVWPEKFEGVTIGEGDIVNIERGREALGLAITAFAMLVYLLRMLFARKSKV